MASAIQSIQGAGEELTEIQSEVLRLEQRLQSVRRTLREAIGGISILETQPSPAPRATPTHARLLNLTIKLPFARSEIWANSGIRMGLIVGSVIGSNNSGQNGGINDDKGKDCNYLGSGDYSPEKAGVGGSTPSLATTFLCT